MHFIRFSLTLSSDSIPEITIRQPKLKIFEPYKYKLMSEKNIVISLSSANKYSHYQSLKILFFILKEQVRIILMKDLSLSMKQFSARILSISLFCYLEGKR